DCTGGACGELYPDFGPLTEGGPLVLPRTGGSGFCQLPPHAACTSAPDCPANLDGCFDYALEAQTPVALESLTSGTADLFAFTAWEAVDTIDRNGDMDDLDAVVTLSDRQTGLLQPLGAPVGCGITGTPEGRAVVEARQGPFQFPATAIEADLTVFLESE